MKTIPDYSLYLVTDRPLCMGRDLLDIIAQALAGGITTVQIREKESPTRDFVELARAAKAMLAPHQVPLIINDRADVALAVNADGLHIGQTDMAYKDARAIMGPEAVIGLSVENRQQALDARDLDVDYLGAGPIFATQTKSDAAPPMGLEGLAQIKKIAPQPIVAIGSINPENAGQTIAAGADGIAVVSAIVSQDDPQAAAASLMKAIQKARLNR